MLRTMSDTIPFVCFKSCGLFVGDGHKKHDSDWLSPLFAFIFTVIGFFFY